MASEVEGWSIVSIDNGEGKGKGERVVPVARMRQRRERL